MKEKKGAIVLGIGALLGGLFLIFRKGKPALAEAPPNGVLVALWNPPKEATMWQLIIYDWDETLINSRFAIPITDPAVFAVAFGAVFPLRVDILIYTPPAVIYYRMHSTENIFPEFYKEAFILDYGSYYFNVSKQRFEKA